MKKIFLIISITLFLSLGFAQTMYNFASIQPTEKLTAEQGKETITKLYFYNIYGNTTTKIKFTAKSDLIVEIEPDNLIVAPTKSLKEKPMNVSGNTEYLTIPSIDGFVETKFVVIKLMVPEGAEVGKHNLTVTATAEWLAAPTNIVQPRDFNYEIDIIKAAEKEIFASDIVSIISIVVIILFLLLLVIVFRKKKHKKKSL